MRLRDLALPILFCYTFSYTALAQPDPGLERLQREMGRLAVVSGGTVGAAAIHLETGRRTSLNGAARFPMASTFKVPIAVQLLTKVDRGEERLDRMVMVDVSDLHPGSGTLSDLFTKPGLQLSVRNLMELMLLISDNSAADILLNAAGGGGAVTERMKALGIGGIDISRPTLQLIADALGMEKLPPKPQWSPELWRSLFVPLQEEQLQAAYARFEEDPRDTATPDAMASLLETIWRGKALKPETNAVLLDIMGRCRTGEARLKGLLPAGTTVVHKTGTIAKTASDAGLITLPGDAGHVALAVFVKSSGKPVPDRERAIAEIARAVHDYFLFQPR